MPNAQAFKKVRKRQATIRGAKPVRDGEYLDFIRQFSCIVCTHGLITCIGQTSFVQPYCQLGTSEAAHIGPRGLRQKCSDRETLPMCFRHHRLGEDAHHVLGKLFFDHHGLDRERLIADFNALFDERNIARRAAGIESRRAEETNK